VNQLGVRAAAAGLTVRATAAWPESTVDDAPPALPGFVVSSFSPLVAEAAERCLRKRYGAPPGDSATAVILVSPLGDVTSAVHVAHAVDSGGRVGPLLFFQSVPNAVAGYIAARWGLTGPVVCVASAEAGMDVATALIEDGDAEEALVVLAEQAGTAGERDSASAVLVGTRVEGLNSTARGDVDSTEGVFGRVGTT